MKLTVRVWRQKNAQTEGKMVDYTVDNISPDMSFLEMLDTLNEQLILGGEEPVAIGQAFPTDFQEAPRSVGIAFRHAKGLPRLFQSRLRLLELLERGAGAHLGHRISSY